MSNSLNGNRPIPSYYFINKEFLGSYTAMVESEECDNLFVGQYVLLMYSNRLFSEAEIEQIKHLGAENTGEAKEFYDRWVADGADVVYDRVIFKKVYNGNVRYIPVGRANCITNETAGQWLDIGEV